MVEEIKYIRWSLTSVPKERQRLGIPNWRWERSHAKENIIRKIDSSFQGGMKISRFTENGPLATSALATATEPCSSGVQFGRQWMLKTYHSCLSGQHAKQKTGLRAVSVSLEHYPLHQADPHTVRSRDVF